MNICNHTIKTSEIVGIGPLMVQYSIDPVILQLYKRKMLWFYLHLKNMSIKLESDWCDFDGVDADQIARNKAYYDGFKKGYDDAKDNITNILAEQTDPA
jgi:hypothetical protein